MIARLISLSAIFLIICAGWTMTMDARTSGGLTTSSVQTPDSLARQSGCVDCHAIDATVIGPSYRAIATRYRDSAGARDYLIRIVKQGGKGKWTEVSHGVPMPPFSRSISDADTRRLVDWVLGLGQ